MNAGEKRWPGYDQVIAADWIERQVVSNQALVTALRQDLDRGEAETIALALELEADLALLDEKEGDVLPGVWDLTLWASWASSWKPKRAV